MVWGLGKGKSRKKIEKGRSSEYRERGFHKIGGIKNPLPTMALMRVFNSLYKVERKVKPTEPMGS